MYSNSCKSFPLVIKKEILYKTIENSFCRQCILENCRLQNKKKSQFKFYDVKKSRKSKALLKKNRLIEIFQLEMYFRIFFFLSLLGHKKHLIRIYLYIYLYT